MAESTVFATSTAIKMGGCPPLTVNDGCGRPLTDTGPVRFTKEKAAPLTSRRIRGERFERGRGKRHSFW